MADYSSYIMIDVSGCASALTHTDDGLDHGYWAKGPPASIGAGVVLGPSDPLNANKGEWPIQAEDNPGPAGSEGWVSFTTDDNSTVTIRFSDSYSADNNYAGITIDRNPGNRYTLTGYYNSGGDHIGSYMPSMPQSGHPIYCRFVITTVDPVPRKSAKP